MANLKTLSVEKWSTYCEVCTEFEKVKIWPNFLCFRFFRLILVT